MKRFMILLVLLLVVSLGMPVWALTKVPVDMVDGFWPLERIDNMQSVATVTADTLSSALASGGLIVLRAGSWDFNGPDGTSYTDITSDTFVWGYGCDIAVSSETMAVIQARVASGVNFAVYGLTINGAGKARRGLQITTPTGAVGGSVVVRDCRIENLHGAITSANSVLGVYVAGDFDFVTVEQTTVQELTRASGVLACQGIVVSTNTASTRIENNRVIGIRATDNKDADGIFVQDTLAAALTVGASQTFPVSITRNLIKDCEGRGVKLQAAGAKVSGNYFELASATTISGAVIGVDAQVGGVHITDNDFLVRSANVTVGASAVMFTLQAQYSRDQNFIVSLNRFRTEQTVPYFLIPFVYSTTILPVSPTFRINDNVLDYQGGGFSNFLYLTFASNTLRLQTTIEASRNWFDINPGNFVVFAGDYWGAATRTASITLELRDNTLQNATGYFMYNNTGASLSLPLLLVAGNSMDGGQPGVNGYTTLNRILPGSSFYYTTNGDTGGIASAPADWQRYVQLTRGRSHVQLSRSSGTNGYTITGYDSGTLWYFPTAFTGSIGYTTASATLGTFTFNTGYLQSVTVP